MLSVMYGWHHHEWMFPTEKGLWVLSWHLPQVEPCRGTNRVGDEDREKHISFVHDINGIFVQYLKLYMCFWAASQSLFLFCYSFFFAQYIQNTKYIRKVKIILMFRIFLFPISGAYFIVYNINQNNKHGSLAILYNNISYCCHQALIFHFLV